jgi:glycerophosphoryl diester phosphodiesterase
VNSTADIQWSIDQGVDYITTDNPLEAKRLIEKK